MTIKRTKPGHTAVRAKRQRPLAAKVARARASDAGDTTSKPMLLGYARRLNTAARDRGRTARFGPNRKFALTQLGARTGHSPAAYSMTSSARARKAGGIVSPSVLAVFRLMTSSNLTGFCTGRSDGLAPFRILSTKSAALR